MSITRGRADTDLHRRARTTENRGSGIGEEPRTQEQAGFVALVLGALGRLRCKLVASEYEIHTAVLEELRREGITRVLHEVKLAGHGRIDFLAQSDGGYGVGIEVKKGKIGSRAIAAQIERYGRDPLVDELVMVIERTVFEPPQVTSTGKRVHYVSLSKNWGVAL